MAIVCLPASLLISSPVIRGRIKEGESGKDDLSWKEIMI
jgi:hypothetical protein